MKANEAPEKIYTDENGNKPLPKRHCDSDIEYVCTDAFIEKATEWLKKNADSYTWYDVMEEKLGMDDAFIVDFKNYMKGE